MPRTMAAIALMPAMPSKPSTNAAMARPLVPDGGAALQPPADPPLAAVSWSSATHICQPGGTGGQLGSGRQPGSGVNPGGGGGQPGGGLKRTATPISMHDHADAALAHQTCSQGGPQWAVWCLPMGTIGPTTPFSGGDRGAGGYPARRTAPVARAASATAASLAALASSAVSVRSGARN